LSRRRAKKAAANGLFARARNNHIAAATRCRGGYVAVLVSFNQEHFNMRKFAFAAVVAVASFGYVVAEEFNANITGIETKDGTTTITYVKAGGGGKKGKKGGAKADPVTVTVTKDVKVNKGDFDADTKKYKAGDKVDKGLQDEMFKDVSADKGVLVRLTIEDDEKSPDKGKVTQILTGVKGGGKKGKGGG
jgi:hypothetical protein